MLCIGVNWVWIKETAGGEAAHLAISGDGHLSRCSPRRSARIRATPAIAKASAFSLQFVWLWRSERTNGTHTSSPKITSIIVSRRIARGAIRFVRRVTAASANRTVVVTDQNI